MTFSNESNGNYPRINELSLGIIMEFLRHNITSHLTSLKAKVYYGFIIILVVTIQVQGSTETPIKIVPPVKGVSVGGGGNTVAFSNESNRLYLSNDKGETFNLVDVELFEMLGKIQSHAMLRVHVPSGGEFVYVGLRVTKFYKNGFIVARHDISSGMWDVVFQNQQLTAIDFLQTDEDGRLYVGARWRPEAGQILEGVVFISDDQGTTWNRLPPFPQGNPPSQMGRVTFLSLFPHLTLWIDSNTLFGVYELRDSIWHRIFDKRPPRDDITLRTPSFIYYSPAVFVVSQRDGDTFRVVPQTIFNRQTSQVLSVTNNVGSDTVHMVVYNTVNKSVNLFIAVGATGLDSIYWFTLINGDNIPAVHTSTMERDIVSLISGYGEHRWINHRSGEFRNAVFNDGIPHVTHMLRYADRISVRNGKLGWFDVVSAGNVHPNSALNNLALQNDNYQPVHGSGLLVYLKDSILHLNDTEIQKRISVNTLASTEESPIFLNDWLSVFLGEAIFILATRSGNSSGGPHAILYYNFESGVIDTIYHTASRPQLYRVSHNKFLIFTPGSELVVFDVSDNVADTVFLPSYDGEPDWEKRFTSATYSKTEHSDDWRIMISTSYYPGSFTSWYALWELDPDDNSLKLLANVDEVRGPLVFFYKEADIVAWTTSDGASIKIGDSVVWHSEHEYKYSNVGILNRTVYFGTYNDGLLSVKVDSITTSLNRFLHVQLPPPYPNPSNTTVAITIPALSHNDVYDSLRIMDVIGRIFEPQIHSSAEHDGALNITLYVGNLPAGVYKVVINGSSKFESSFVVVK